jgi:hypothetical protein
MAETLISASVGLACAVIIGAIKSSHLVTAKEKPPNVHKLMFFLAFTENDVLVEIEKNGCAGRLKKPGVGL